jgi:hypothetical protein
MLRFFTPCIRSLGMQDGNKITVIRKRYTFLPVFYFHTLYILMSEDDGEMLRAKHISAQDRQKRINSRYSFNYDEKFDNCVNSIHKTHC